KHLKKRRTASSILESSSPTHIYCQLIFCSIARYQPKSGCLPQGFMKYASFSSSGTKPAPLNRTMPVSRNRIGSVRVQNKDTMLMPDRYLICYHLIYDPLYPIGGIPIQRLF